MATAVETKKKVNLGEVQEGDVFSEISHYVYVKTDTNGVSTFKHLEGKREVQLGKPYVESLLTSANQHSTEVYVGKEDKLWTQKQILEGESKGDFPKGTYRAGDIRVKGLRTLFEEIYDSEVFMLSFDKAPKELSAKALKEAREKQNLEAVTLIEKAASSKKGVANTAKELIAKIQENPILPVEKGEERILVGYKTQFNSRDGRYNCYDMEINEVRPVNINTLNWLVRFGVKYIKE